MVSSISSCSLSTPSVPPISVVIFFILVAATFCASSTSRVTFICSIASIWAVRLFFCPLRGETEGERRGSDGR